MKRAVIDIGSNSVRLMLWADGKTLLKKINTTRLGAGLLADGTLSAESMQRTCDAVTDFIGTARAWGAESIHAFATAAVRLAKNGGTLADMIYHTGGVKVDIIAGEDEALLAICGALGGRDGAVVDIGGASSEVCIRKRGEIAFCTSLNVGAVLLFRKFGERRSELEEYIRTVVSPLAAWDRAPLLTAVGGTATTIASVHLGLPACDPEAIGRCVLTRQEVSALVDRLFSLSVAQRKELPGMDVRRADILPGGALLLLCIMDALDADKFAPSDRDNLEGYLAVRGLL